MPEHPDLVAANEAFYQAFNRRDVAAMDALWASDAPVACIHPGWQALVGREEVMESWGAILAGDRSPRVRITEPVAHVYGDSGFVLCVEEIDGEALAATNVFTREDGAWKIVHHHAGPIARRTPREPQRRTPPRDLN